MTTEQYRGLVIGQIAAACALGAAVAVILVCAVPQCRSRYHLAKATEHYLVGMEAGLRQAVEELDRALANEPGLPAALGLRGRIALQQGDAATARDTYKDLERALLEEGLSDVPALNGIGCTLLLEATRHGANDRKRIEEAYAEFASAVNRDGTNGDPHVHAAICSLYMGDVVKAASHLASARETRDLSYESAVTYYAAVASMLALASGKGDKTASAVANEFGDPAPRLRKTGQMLFRAADELDKAIELARDAKTAARLRASAALLKAKLLAWAPLESARAIRYRQVVYQALSEQEALFTSSQRQLLRLVLGVSHHRFGEIDHALRWVRRAATTGKLSPETNFYVGAAMLALAESKNGPANRAELESEAAKHLRAALAKPGLPGRMRFRSLSDLATARWHANDPSGALEQMDEAGKILAKLEGHPGAPAGEERSTYYRNLGIMLYKTGRPDAAAGPLRKTLEIDNNQNAVRHLLARITHEPVIRDIKIIVTKQHPPSMPIIMVEVSSGGAVPLRKQEISVKIDGERVAFIVGPNNRIYALPRNALAEGRHTATPPIATAGGQKAQRQEKFRVSYGRFRPAAAEGGGH